MAEFDENELDHSEDEQIHHVVPVSGMYENWFLEYASYVILERAVPAIGDGLKPVQRRILHSMKEMDDGRFNKVANVIGHTMQYHPHGDAAIGDAIVNLGQKDLLLETQGNWGDTRTGDRAAAARYIEARLSKLAHAIVFNPQTTDWQLSYDGRKKEPTGLPVKFPLILAQGVEGIAVGLATKIMPHNFCEICEGSIAVLKGKKPKIYPDFSTGGTADVSNYNDGLKGGKIRVRADLEIADKKTILVKSVPYGINTSGMIDSIIRANDQGKIKIKKVIDNTAKYVELEIQLGTGVSPDVMIDALYAFTDCEVSISPNNCVIIDDKPVFMGSSEMLRICTEQTVDLLRRELEIKKLELQERIFFTTLLKIFIVDGMYKDARYEGSSTFDDTVKVLYELFDKYLSQFYREIQPEDFKKLVDKPLSSITRVDIKREDERMITLQEEIDKVEYNLANIIDYTIAYYQNLLDKFGKDKQRKTILTEFEAISAKRVVANNAKLYVNYKEGFVGMSLKKDEFVSDCSDIDDIVVFRKDGKMMVTRISDKTFVGKDIIHAQVWKKGDDRMVYNLAYLEGGNGATMVKRFAVTSITRDKEYDLTKGNARSKVLYFSANPNGEAEIITTYLTSGCTAKKKVFDFDFKNLAIKGRGAGGNRLTKYPVRRVEQKSKGVSTLSGIKIWYDDTVGRINTENRGIYVGEFDGDDHIIAFYKNGDYELSSYDLVNRYDNKNLLLITRFSLDKVFSMVHYDGGSKNHYVKRFKIETTTANKKFSLVTDENSSKALVVSAHVNPIVSLTYRDGRKHDTQELSLVSIIDVKGWKAIGNKLSNEKVVKVELLSPQEEEREEASAEEIQSVTKAEKVVKPETKQEEKSKSDILAEAKKEEKRIETGDTIDLSPKKKDVGDDNGQTSLF